MVASLNGTGERRELFGWSQIASYLGVTEPTARKYAKNEGLPVTKRGGRYYAFTDEIDLWKLRQSQRVSQADLPAERQPEEPGAQPAIERRAKLRVRRGRSRWMSR